jgi:hypothetical protein
MREHESRCWTSLVSGGGLPEVDVRASRRWTFAVGGGELFEKDVDSLARAARPASWRDDWLAPWRIAQQD